MKGCIDIDNRYQIMSIRSKYNENETHAIGGILWI